MNPLALAAGLALDYAYVARRQFDVLRTDPEPEDYLGGPLRPVVLLPGIYEDWRFLSPLADRLSQSGHPVHVVPDLARNRATIAASARVVAEFIVGRGLDDVVIVAHSKGGLIGKHLMVDSPAADRVTGMVAINTPFAGSRWARYALRRELREFSPRDQLLRRHATILDVNARITSVFSSLDQVVPDGSVLPGAERNVRVPFVGHFRLLEDARVLALVDAICSRERPDGQAAPEGARGRR